MKTAHLQCILCVSISTLFNSCVAITPHLVRRDADGLRSEVNEYYKEEILRNAIKEFNHEPYVHVDITQLNSTLSTSLNSTDGGSHQSLSTTGAITKVFSWNLTPGITNQVNINSTPVIYDAGLRKLYMKFASLAPVRENKPASIKKTGTKRPRPLPGTHSKDGWVWPVESSREKPLPGTYIKDGLLIPTKDFLFYGSEDQFYYWIPIEFHDAFFDLCMAVMTRTNPQPGAKPNTPTPVVNVGPK